jgi:DNA-binding transcriptional ArsR family regulator
LLDSKRLAEVITTDNERIKAIGEIFANDTSRDILIKIFSRIDTPSKISNALGLSLPLVLYHLKKLEDSGLIRIGKVGLSSKLHKVNHYVPVKVVFVLIPSAALQSEPYRDLIRRALSDVRGMLSTAVFAGVSAAFYAVISAGAESQYVVTPVYPNDFINVIMTNVNLLLSLLAGGVSTLITIKKGVIDRLVGIKKKELGLPKPSSGGQ